MKILVTGGSGLVGKNLQKMLPEAYYISSKDCDLTNKLETIDMFLLHKPTHVIHLASMVGGMLYNEKYPALFFEQNIAINTNVVIGASLAKVDRFVGMLSTCIFSDNVEYPLTVDKIHNGEPHYTNFGYAYAKRMMEVHIRAHNIQHGTNWTTLIPTNIYGKYDQFNLQKAHVIPALIHKIYLEHLKGNDSTGLTLVGTGVAEREFLYAGDLAKIISWAIFNYTNPRPLIVSSRTFYSIQEVARMIADIIGYDKEITFDGNASKDGQLRKPSDSSMLRELYPIEYTSLRDGLQVTIDWFIQNYLDIRR